MSRSRINILIHRCLPAKILGCIAALILGLSIVPSLSFAKNCSVTTMATDGTVLACQIEDMRRLINEARAACALGAISPYVFQPILANQSLISVKHVIEIENAIKGISNQCGTIRPEAIFKTLKENDIISKADFVKIYNDFVAVPFCGDAVCQANFENILSCGVDCGGKAQFYCNGIDGCYAGVTCPSGKKCYSVLQDCLNNRSVDCSSCRPDCTGADTKTSCQSWPDGCGGLCWGTQGGVHCACAQNTCVGNTCTDSCGTVCPGTKAPDLSCAANICPTQTCSDGCGGVVVGTGNECPCATVAYQDDKCQGKCGWCQGSLPLNIKPYQKCGAGTAVEIDGTRGSFLTLTGYQIYRCAGNCVPTDADLVSPLLGMWQAWEDTNVAVGQTYTYVRKPIFSDRQGNFGVPASITVLASPPGMDCSCASSIYNDSQCGNGCGGFCLGTKVRSINVFQECAGTANIQWNKGDFPTMDGYYVYRCSGNCTPVEADKVSPLVPLPTSSTIIMNWVDTGLAAGQVFTYAIKPHFTDQDPGVFSQAKTITIGTGVSSCASCAGNTCQGDTCVDSCGKSCGGTKLPDCSCAANTCQGSFCDNGCMNGTYCAGTKPTDCSCSSNTCVGSSCVSTCGGVTCAGSKQPSCSCAANTCAGQTCSDGCGGTCAGTKDCTYAPIQCKKYTCSSSLFCLQDHTETCSCPQGLKPACYPAAPTACGTNTCPDTTCQCLT